jgi:hypothetical protein
MGGHSGFLVTYHRIKKIFAWPGLKKSVKEWVDKCDICKKAKPAVATFEGASWSLGGNLYGLCGWFTKIRGL